MAERRHRAHRREMLRLQARPAATRPDMLQFNRSPGNSSQRHAGADDLSTPLAIGPIYLQCFLFVHFADLLSLPNAYRYGIALRSFSFVAIGTNDKEPPSLPARSTACLRRGRTFGAAQIRYSPANFAARQRTPPLP